MSVLRHRILEIIREDKHPFVIPSEARNLSFFPLDENQERFLASLGMTKA
jgi:hypothetical protein